MFQSGEIIRANKFC